MATRPPRRILLVEDDPDILEVTTLLLSKAAGYEVLACNSGVEALEQAALFSPDLILLDLMMPELDGRGTFAALRRLGATARTPVVFMTAMAGPRDTEEYEALGALGVIPKPYDPDTLVARIQGFWDRHQEAQRSQEDELAALRRLYAADLPERLGAIERAAADLQDRWDPGVAARLHEMAHRLAGSAAMYGFQAVSEAAQRLGRFASQDGAPRDADPGPLRKLVAALARAVEAPARRALPSPPGAPASS